MLSSLHYLRQKATHVATSFNSNENRRPKYALMLLLPFFAILAQAPFVTVRGQKAAAINLTVLNPDTICLSAEPTQTIVGFRATNFTSLSNVFTVQLSNASGSFANPTQIGQRTNDIGPLIALVANIPGNLPPGNGYLIRVVSTNPAVTSANTKKLVIQNSPAISLTLSASPVSGCNGGSDGVIMGIASGGTGAYNFGLHPPDGNRENTPNSITVSNLPPNTIYEISVKDAAGCITRKDTTLVQIPSPTIEVSTKGNVSACGPVGTDNGKGFFTIRVFPRDGTIATAIKPYTWTVNGLPTSPTPEPSAPFKFSNLLPDTYSVSMTDGAGCVSTSTISTTIGTDGPVGLVLSGWGNPTSCGGTNGDITVQASKGSQSTYRYSISKDGGAFSTPQSGRRFTGLAAGTYTIHGMDSRGCTATLVKTLNNPKGCTSVIAGPVNDLNLMAKNSLKLQALPNPTTTSFTLNLQNGSKEGVQIIVTDMFGKKLYQTAGSSNRQYTFGNEFNSGMYIVQVIQGKQIQTLKLVKGN